MIFHLPPSTTICLLFLFSLPIGFDIILSLPSFFRVSSRIFSLPFLFFIPSQNSLLPHFIPCILLSSIVDSLFSFSFRDNIFFDLTTAIALESSQPDFLLLHQIYEAALYAASVFFFFAFEVFQKRFIFLSRYFLFFFLQLRY